jgi:tRNA (guanine-N7-)-methyltransferase
MIPDLPVSEVRTHDLVRLEPPDDDARVDLAQLFGRAAPVELEIGVGKGRFLMLAATARPDTDFIGVEYARAYAEKTIDRLGKRGLTNVRVVHADAASFVRERLPNGCLSAVHVYFPDPWPKKRHHKRRIVRRDVLDELARTLRARGALRIVTDHPAYAEVIRERLDQHEAFADPEPSSTEAALPGMDDLVKGGVTNFEIKYRREGRPIHSFVRVRV